jgi:shikimate kinase
MMKQTHTNLVLIGMPGSGKSTVGVILAKKTSRDFVDTDVLIQTSRGRILQEIVDADGYAVLRKIEENVLLNLFVQNHVIATGGSAVYRGGKGDVHH